MPKWTCRRFLGSNLGSISCKGCGKSQLAALGEVQLRRMTLGRLIGTIPTHVLPIQLCYKTDVKKKKTSNTQLHFCFISVSSKLSRRRQECYLLVS
jgi:hypothetical protein